MGYYLEVTADNDWCEPNYAHSYYVAEMGNTLTASFLTIFGVIGACSSAKRDDIAIPILYIWMAIVGIGSMLYHGTLQRWAQQADEFPMMVSTVYFIYAMTDERGKVDVYHRNLFIFFFGLCGVIYFMLPFWAFIVGYIIEVTALYYISTKRAQGNASNEKLLNLGFGCYCAALFFFWVPEQVLCGSYPWIDNLKLHCIFHILSVYGVNAWIVFTAAVRGPYDFYYKYGFWPCIKTKSN